MDHDQTQQISQLNELIGKHFRDKYLNPPHYSVELSRNLQAGLEKYTQDISSGVLESEPLLHTSGQYIQPLEYKGWKRNLLLPHVASKALSLLQHVDRQVNNNGESELEYLYGIALYHHQGVVYIAIILAWRCGAAFRRAKRAAQNLHIDAANLGARLTAELLHFRLSRGLSAKVSQEFARTLHQPTPQLPSSFSSYSTITLRYNASLPPESILDHAYDASLKHITQQGPEEYDTHLAIAYISAKDAQAKAEPPAPAEVVLHVARLWRAKSQMMQQLQKIPAKIDSRQLEAILKERVSAFQGLEPGVWSPALSHQLHSMYNPSDSNAHKKVLTVPDDCVWLNHTSVTFHNWPVRSIAGFISSNSFWSTASHHSKPVSALRCAVSILPCGGPTSVHLQKHTAQHYMADAPSIQAYTSETSLTVAMAIAWTWKSDKYIPTPAPSSTLSVPVPLVYEDTDEEIHYKPQHIIATPSIHPAQSIHTSGYTERLRSTLDSRASVRHYNVEPRLISAPTRELIWPTTILPRLLLSGELPASNLAVLADYGVTHVVVTASTIPCTFSSQLNYLKISENDDYSLQIQTFVAYIESLSHADHMVLVAGRRGYNRSAGLVIALVMRHAGLTLREAVDYVAARRTIHLATFVKEALQKLQQNLKGGAGSGTKETKPQLA